MSESFTAQKMQFSANPQRISSVNVTKSAGNCGLVTFTEAILNGKLHVLCRVLTWHRGFRVNLAKFFENIIFDQGCPNLKISEKYCSANIARNV